MNTWLVDTGPLIAYLDRNDPAHHEVASQLDGFKGQLVTTSAVIHEAMHMVATDPWGPHLLGNFISESGIQIYDLSYPSEILAASNLISQFSDTQMAYADATLLLLAEGLLLKDVLTLNRRGFSLFHTKGRRPLRLVLG